MFGYKLALFPFFFALLLASCGDNAESDTLSCSNIECLMDESNFASNTGWRADKENINNIPQDISIFDGSTDNLPSSHSLEQKFPPIGDQGQYGTCVAWATGYNLKTSLNAIEKGWGSADLSKTANQTSPKDLWLAIASSERGTNCEGTNFESALDALILKGAASISSVPYSNLGNCSGYSNGNANNKLANYRKIAYNNVLAQGRGAEGLTLNNFKSYLAQGRPVLIGAKLGDRFMRWNNSSTISSDTYNDPNMQHAYHALVLVAYDDSKYAFKLRNSWGSSWGDKGSIWVDYDFFLKSFVFAAFVAQNTPPTLDDGNDSDDGKIKEDQLLTGYDLLAAFAADYQAGNSPTDREMYYDVYNSGQKTISASQRWSIIYMYYNAFNANESGVIFEDYYTNEIPNSKPGEYGDYYNYRQGHEGFWNYMDIQPSQKLRTGIGYSMPKITGDYYLVVYADAYDKITESNEDNNFYFIGAEGGKPLKFVRGVIQNNMASSAKALAKKGFGIPKATAKSIQEIGGNANAYTPKELKALILQSKRNGILAKQVEEYRESGEKPLKKRLWSEN